MAVAKNAIRFEVERGQLSGTDRFQVPRPGTVELSDHLDASLAVSHFQVLIVTGIKGGPERWTRPDVENWCTVVDPDPFRGLGTFAPQAFSAGSARHGEKQPGMDGFLFLLDQSCAKSAEQSMPS